MLPNIALSACSFRNFHLVELYDWIFNILLNLNICNADRWDKQERKAVCEHVMANGLDLFRCATQRWNDPIWLSEKCLFLKHEN